MFHAYNLFFAGFRASVYTNVDRLCKFFLYSICCFHDFIEYSAPAEIHWITLIHYRNDVNTENCFQNGGRLSSWISENFHFWSRGLYLHVILHLQSEIRIHWPIWRRDIAKKRFSIWRPSAIFNLNNFDFFSSDLHARNGNLHLCTKFDRNRIIHGCDMVIK